MSNRGRYGKYGETKRLERLRRAGQRASSRARHETREPGRGEFFTGRKPAGSLFSLRHALDGDLAYIEELSGRVFEVYGPYREMVGRWFQSRKAATLVALMGVRPVGFAMVGRFSDPSRIPLTAELLAIAVEPRRQKRGVGRMLMEGIEEILLPMNVGRLFLHTAMENLPAQSLFARCGYRHSGAKSAFYPAGQDALLMTKDLLRGPRRPQGVFWY